MCSCEGLSWGSNPGPVGQTSRSMRHMTSAIEGQESWATPHRSDGIIKAQDERKLSNLP